MYHSISTGIFSTTGHCYHYPAQHVPNLIREVTDGTSESTKFDSFKLNTTLSNLRRKFNLGSTFDLEAAFHMCRI